MNKLLRSTWLPIVFGLCLFVSLYAATPSFTSFDQAWFTTNNLRISFRSNNVPILTTSNIFATNIYATNIYISTNITITTNITINSNIVATYNDLIWTNDSSFGGNGRITVKPEVTYEYLYPSNTIFAGWVSYVPQFKLMASGSNNIPCNMYSSFLIVGADPDPSVAQLYLQSGAVFGQDLLLFSYTNTPFNGKFTLPADSAVVGGIGNVKLANGQDWVGENGAVLRLFWADPDWWEVGRWYAGGTNQPTTVTMNPTDGYLPVRTGPDTFGDSPWYTNSTDVLTDGRIGFGPGLTNWLYRDYSGMDLIYTNQNATQVRFGVASDTGLIYMTALSGYGGEISASGGLNLSNGSDLLTLYGGQLYPSVDNSVSLGIDIRAWKDMSIAGPIYFTPGTTNQLYRSGNSLVITNGSATNFLKIVNGSANELQLGFTTSGQPLLTSSTGFLFTDSAVFLPGSAQPNGTASLGLGNSSSGYWDGVYSQDEIVINGFNPGGSGGNYSQVNIKHTGTNGAVMFTSQASGTAGSPRPFVFTNASVNFGNAQQLGYPPFSQTPLGFLTNIVVTNLASGDTDLMTVPAGYRLLTWPSLAVTTNATSTALYWQIKTNAVYYRPQGSSSSITTNVVTTFVGATVLEPGEAYSVNTSLAGVSLVVTGVLFPITEPLNSHRFVGFAAGANTIYTVSNGKTYYPYTTTSPFGSTATAYVNNSGAPRTVSVYLVPPSSDGILIMTKTLSDNTAQAFTIPALVSGTSIVIVSDSNASGQMAYMTGAEY